MSKKQKKKKSRAFPTTGSQSAPTPPKPPTIDRSPTGKRPMRWDLVVLFLSISLGGAYMVIFFGPNSGVPRYTFEVLKDYPHDPAAFTQGIVLGDGFLWESTGKYGESTIRKIDLDTGEIIKQVPLDDKVFGEGLALLDGKLIQITWKAGIAYVYDLELNKVGEHRYAGQGWGLTHDGNRLILSDGTARLRFLDPQTFDEIGGLTVRNGKRRVSQLNELEYVNGHIYANQWESDLIYEIDPNTGAVTAIIDLTGIWPSRDRPPEGLLNGIAFNSESKKLLVTGKLCPKIFEIDLQMVE